VIESAPCADCARRLRLILDGGEVTDDLIADMVEVLTGFCAADESTVGSSAEEAPRIAVENAEWGWWRCHTRRRGLLT